MGKINNKNGIEMYWERAEDIDKIIIFDSNKKYFNDLYLNIYAYDDIKDILKMFEETNLENMCGFLGARVYESLEELADKEELYLSDYLQHNDYLNEFNVNGKTYYTWSW